ncbi:hypothetical protein B0H16DRAFT_1800332 [Mycena metata]|uniref:Uncharacterized protein n=1 Tax=Mycena metata TaxID=1033252 RepID=A0AAD7MGW6_9AGAR|nr:hypothetical protein B0H16DRAFT_1800332 [Mycena metata]
MHILFRPHPLLPPFDRIVEDKTLPYGPFQPIADANAIPNDTPGFTCDAAIWELWVEFHQKLRPWLAFPELDAVPAHIHMRHILECADREPAMEDFKRRLTNCLIRVHELPFPTTISDLQKWEKVLAGISLSGGARSGVIDQETLWACIIHELTQFHRRYPSTRMDPFLPPMLTLTSTVKLGRRATEITSRVSLTDLLWVFGIRIKNTVGRPLFLTPTVLSFPAPTLPSAVPSADVPRRLALTNSATPNEEERGRSAVPFRPLWRLLYNKRDRLRLLMLLQ